MENVIHNDKNNQKELGLMRIPSSPKLSNLTQNNFNKSNAFQKKLTLQRELTLESPKANNEKKEKIVRIATSPQKTLSSLNNLHTKNSEIITLNTENKENQIPKFLMNHRVYFNKNSKYEAAKFSNKPYGYIAAYAANTNQGQVRNYNEDRVSIILNVIKPHSRQGEEWPKVSFFGIYDGHGGNRCSDFLKENLHHYIFREACFPTDPMKAITKGFEECERSFMVTYKPKSNLADYDRSGSCAICVIIMDDVCYVANLGDSRAIYSENRSNVISTLSTDHKPNEELERRRIKQNGGYIYQGNQIYSGFASMHGFDMPWRIFPGRLVSRAFGDIEAKFSEFGGNSKVLISSPQIISFKTNDLSDFIVLGSDGIFDKLSNKQITDCVWAAAYNGIKSSNIEDFCGKVTDMIMKQSLHAGTIDNITCIFICFNNLKNILSHRFSDATLIKREYSPVKEKISIFNIDEIRKRIFNFSEKNIQLKKNENLNFFHLAFSESLRDAKPKTSSDALKSKHSFNPYLPQFTNSNSNNNLDCYLKETEENMKTDESEAKRLVFKIASKNKIPSNSNSNIDFFKESNNNKNNNIISCNSNSNLPTFRINQQRINRLSKKSIEIDNLSTPTGYNTNLNFFNSHRLKKNLISNQSLNKNSSHNINFNNNTNNNYNNACNEKIQKMENQATSTNYRNFYSNRLGNSNNKEEPAINQVIFNKKISMHTSNNFLSKNSKAKALPSISKATNIKRNLSEKFSIYKFTKTSYQNFNTFSPNPNNFRSQASNINTVNLNFENNNRSGFSNKNLSAKNKSLSLLNVNSVVK